MGRKSRLTIGVPAAVVALSAAGCQQASPDGPARGRTLYASCVSCHGADGGGDRELEAPGIAGLELIVQARMCAPTGPVGPLSPDWVSNGLVLTLGCF